MKTNVPLQTIEANIKKACNLPVNWFRDSMCFFKGEVAIIGGAPSIKDKLDEIKALPKDTMILSVNGTHDWLVDNGVNPDFYVQLDARADNDFVNKPLDNCVYFLASQCNEKIFKKLLDKNIVLWHCEYGGMDKHFINEQCIKRNILVNLMVSGKGSVTLTAMCLAHTLGFRKFKLYGMDSSFDKQQHAYKQPQNEKDKVIEFEIGKKKFKTTPNLAGQLVTYLEMQPLFEDSTIEVCCNGLIKEVNSKNINQLKEIL